jgi:hypothetical protein
MCEDADRPADMDAWPRCVRHPGDGPATGADDDRLHVNTNRGVRLHLWTPPRS